MPTVKLKEVLSMDEDFNYEEFERLLNEIDEDLEEYEKNVKEINDWIDKELEEAKQTYLILYGEKLY